MTINISTKTIANILVYHHAQEGVEGYMMVVSGAAPQFIEEAEADKLARYMLFNKPEGLKVEQPDLEDF